MKRIPMAALLMIACMCVRHVNAGQALRVENVLLTLIEEVELPAKEPGAMAELAVREGDVVEPGRQLALIEDDEARMAASKAEGELAIARTKAENDVAVRFARKAQEVAAAEYRRAQESVEKFHKSVSATEMDQLRLTTEKSLLEIEQAELEQSITRLTMRQKEAELESAQLKLKRHRLTAPFAGMVVQIKKHRGEWLNPGDSVLRLVRLDRLRVEAFVPARDFAAHLEGRRATLIIDAPRTGPAQFEGTVVFVSPEVDPVNGQVRLWAEVDNEQLLLRPGQPATLIIEADSSTRQIDRRKSTR
ncbi:MAG: efflux RND transporter periplasmic adaptor subunit [Pirellulales bacterium]